MIKASKKILLIEEDEICKLIIKNYLAKINLSLDITNNIQEATELMKQNLYDIIFIEIKLFQMNIFNYINTPIIITLGTTNNQLRIEPDYLLKKPINKDEFFKIINKSINLNMLDKNNYTKNLINSFGEELTIELLNAFKEQHNDFEIKLITLKNEDFFDYIHKLKGSANSLNFKNINRICLEIEQTKPIIVEILVNKLLYEMKVLFKSCLV